MYLKQEESSKSLEPNAPTVWPHFQGKRPAWRYINTHTNINIGGRPPVNYKVDAMFSLTLRTKDGFEIELKVNVYLIILSITSLLYWIA